MSETGIQKSLSLLALIVVQKKKKTCNNLNIHHQENEEVMKMRTMYSEGTPSRKICEIYPNVSENTIKAILYGKSYKKLPYWNVTQKKWIEPCIDYPQSLK